MEQPKQPPMEQQPAKLYAWKFIIPPGHFRKLAPGDQPPGNVTVVDVAGCLAVAVAASQEEALDVLVRWARANGDDHRWLKVAQVRRIDIDLPCPICWDAA